MRRSWASPSALTSRQSTLAPTRDYQPKPSAVGNFGIACFRQTTSTRLALVNELLKLGTAPSPANYAVNELWKEWDWAKLKSGNVYAVLFSITNSPVVLCGGKSRSGGPLCRLVKSPTTRPSAVELPTQAFAVVPISNVVANVTDRYARLLGDDKTWATALSIDHDLNR
jgi:hypothetical protein